MRSLFPAIAGLALAATATASHATTELVSNGGFESGLAGWSCTGADLCGTTSAANSGSLAFEGYENSGFGTLSQSVSTIAGQTYDVSFFSMTWDYPGNVLRYSLDGGPAVTAVRTTSYAQTFASFVASGASAAIEFYFETDPGTAVWRIDDVSVTGATSAVPLPAALPLMASGFAVLGVAARRRRRPSKG